MSDIFEKLSQEAEGIRLREERQMLDKPIKFAWDRPITLDFPAEISGGKVTRTETRKIPIRYAVESMRTGATTARDRIVAEALLAIMDEIEKQYRQFHADRLEMVE